MVSALSRSDQKPVRACVGEKFFFYPSHYEGPVDSHLPIIRGAMFKITWGSMENRCKVHYVEVDVFANR